MLAETVAELPKQIGPSFPAALSGTGKISTSIVGDSVVHPLASVTLTIQGPEP